MPDRWFLDDHFQVTFFRVARISVAGAVICGVPNWYSISMMLPFWHPGKPFGHLGEPLEAIGAAAKIPWGLESDFIDLVRSARERPSTWVRL